MTNGDAHITIKDLRTRIGKFVEDRNWKKYHDPKNLAASR